MSVERLKSGALQHVLRGPRQPEELAAQHVRLALEPARRLAARATSISSSTCSAPSTACWARISATRARRSPRRCLAREAPDGKLDLLVTIDFRMSTTCLYSDIVLPTATWYEKNDLNTSDMHPFIHPLTAAVDPVVGGAQRLGHLQGHRRGVLRGRARGSRRREGLVLTPILHDTPAELAQPLDVKDWKRGECEPVPGKTMPSDRPWSSATTRTPTSVHRRSVRSWRSSATAARASAGTPSTRSSILAHLNGVVTEEGIDQGHAADRDRRRRERGRS